MGSAWTLDMARMAGASQRQAESSSNGNAVGTAHVRVLLPATVLRSRLAIDRQPARVDTLRDSA
jgi:hypothetical protein